MSELLPLPTLQFEVPPQPSKDLGRKGDLKWIAIERLRIDPSYQRDVGAPGKRNIKRIIEGFSWSLFSPVIVSPRPGNLYAIIDGQHRAIAAAMNGGMDELPCLVLHTDIAGEARAFGAINGLVTKVHSLALYRARLVAAEKGAKDVDRVCKAAGVLVAPYPKTDMKPGETLAAITIEQMIARYGDTTTIRALKLITQTKADDGNAGLVKDAIINACCDVLHGHPKWAESDRAIAAVDADGGVRALFSAAMRRYVEGEGSIRALFQAQLVERLQKTLGDGGKPASAETKLEEGRRLARAAHARSLVKVTGGGAPKKAAPSNRATQDERAAIDDFLKSKGPRKFESGATGHTSELLDWLARECKRKTRRHSPAAGKGTKVYEVDGKRYDLAGLIAIVNKERLKRKLEPITSNEASAPARRKAA